MSNWDKVFKDSATPSSHKGQKRDFDDYDGELVEKSKSKKREHRSRSSNRINEQDNDYI